MCNTGQEFWYTSKATAFSDYLECVSCATTYMANEFISQLLSANTSVLITQI